MSFQRFKTIWIVMLMAILFLAPSCSGKDKESASKKPEMSSQKVPKAPPEMETLLSDLEKVITNLEQKVKMEKSSALQQNTKMADSNQSQQDQAQKQEQEKPEAEKKEGSTTSPENPMDTWQKEIGSLKSIHKSWNKLEPEAVKAGLSLSHRDSFEKALEKLTLETSEQKKEASLLAAIELYGQYPNLVRLFDTPIPPEFFKTKYEIMSTAFEANQAEWKAAQQRVPIIKETWNQLKAQTKSKDNKLISRTEFSIEDLEPAINNEQIDTLMIKIEIVMNNFQQLEKELSKISSTSQ